MGIVLSVDFGEKKCGIAVSDPTQTIASALTTLETEKVINFINDYDKCNKISGIVVGFPMNLDCSPTDATTPTLNFVSKLKREFKKISIDLIDERFTSKIAFQTLIDLGVKKKKRRDKMILDRISATLILQTYLDKKNQK